jgi:AraC-like DNA-binding protein
MGVTIGAGLTPAGCAEDGGANVDAASHGLQVPRADLSSATVTVQVVRSVLALSLAAGVTKEALMRGASLDPARLDDPRARFTYREVYQVCDAVLSATGEPDFGLRWASAIDDRTLAPVSHLVHHAPTLREALATLGRFQALMADELGWTVTESGELVTLRIATPHGAPLGVERMISEMQLCGFRHLLRGYASDAQLRDVSFRYPAPPYAAAYHEAFAAPLRFEQPGTGLRFARALLDRPALSPDPEMFETLQGLAERRVLAIRGSAPYAMRLREHVVRGGWRRRDDMDAAARSLGISVRTLRRRLAEEGTSFSAVVSEAMAVVATDLLRDPRRTIQEAAFELGFSEASTFHRAFRRWTGTTPSAFRRSL